MYKRQPTSGNELSNWVTSANSYQKAVIDSGGIPLLYGIDAVHGNNNLYGATIYPHNIGLAAANNTQLVEQIGEEMGIRDSKTPGREDDEEEIKFHTKADFKEKQAGGKVENCLLYTSHYHKYMIIEMIV